MTDTLNSEVERQLERAGYRPCLNRYTVSPDGKKLVGNVQLSLVDMLRQDTAFASGKGYGYHLDVGPDLVDFRSHTGEFGKGSLQGVISRVTGDCYFDVDRFSPYSDVVGFVGHTGELIAHTFGKLFGRRRPKQEDV